ncbi:MAG TPA: zf-HC2 domain-containing protein [Bryobacteraceae bacterium]|nr:zf-HC2 domain-containing protein [Bryobacteraceae bacterium]
MSTSDNPECDRADLVRDYAFDELAPAERKSMEQHFASCAGCAAELDRLRLTTAALRVIPDVEVPRRIAFVSDKVLEPKMGWLAAFWNSGARLGFASACVLAGALTFFAAHRQTEVRTVVQTAGASQGQIDSAIAKAVSEAVEKTHADDARLTQAALNAVDAKYEAKQQELVVNLQQSYDYLRKQSQTAERALYRMPQ